MLIYMYMHIRCVLVFSIARILFGVYFFITTTYFVWFQGDGVSVKSGKSERSDKSQKSNKSKEKKEEEREEFIVGECATILSSQSPPV